MVAILNLNQIAEIRTGHTFKSKISDSPEGTISVFQPGDMAHGELISEPSKVTETEIRSLEHHVLRPNDILLGNKGTRFSTYLYNNSLSQRSVAASSFFVIRPNKNLVHPEYLVWFLGRPEITNGLQSLAKGSTVSSLKLSTVGDLKVTVPPMHVQNDITRMITKGKKREAAYLKLVASKRESIELYCLDLIKHAHEDNH